MLTRVERAPGSPSAFTGANPNTRPTTTNAAAAAYVAPTGSRVLDRTHQAGLAVAAVHGFALTTGQTAGC